MRAPWIPMAITLALAVGVACSPDHAASGIAVAEDAGADAEDDAAHVTEADAGDDAASTDAGDDAASTDGGDAGTIAVGPPLPSFADEPFPEKGTAFPAPPEWDSAAPVAIDRAHPASLFAAHAGEKSPCTARRIREWVRVHCVTMNGGALLLGGNRGALSIRFDKASSGTEVIIPVRRGDRRVIELLDTETVFFKVFSAVRAKFGFTLSEQWPPGDERPTLVAE